MQSSRAIGRAARSVRVNTPAVRQNIRRYAEGQQVSGGGVSTTSGSGHYVGGAIGGVVATVTVLGLWYQFSGVGKAAQSVGQAKKYFESATEQLKVKFNENTPEPNEALEALKSTAQKYATFIPGGRQFVDNAFKDIDVIRKNHGEEVDNIVKDAYGELREASKNGLSMETASQSWNVLSKYLHKLSSLAVDAGEDILNNHPQVKKQLGGSFDQLKQFGDELGPEAKQQVEQTYKEIKDVINEGLNFNTVDKIRKLIHDKVQQLKQLRDKAWHQGYEQVQPMLEKNPQVKQLVEENADTLKNGKVTEVFEKVKQAITNGDTSSLNEYIQSAKQKADQFSSGQFSSSSMSSWLGMIPGGSAILPQLQKLRHIAESQGPEAEKLAKDTMADLQQVLDKRSKEVEDLYNKAQSQAKN